MEVRETPGEGGAQRIAISYAGYNRPWAAWIADRLERYGCRVTFQRWDAPIEVPLEEQLRDLLLLEGRILVVLSDWYFRLGPHPEEAWNHALRTVVAPNTHRFAAVSVTAEPLPPATAAFGGTADLWGIGAREAERRLLSLLGITPGTHATPPGGVRTDRRGAGPRFPHEQPRVWGGVPRRNIRFTGREDTLRRMYEALQRAEPGTGVVTLLGMSGVGKTQIAVEYVHRFGSEYDMVWWVPADQRGTLRQRLAELAPALDLHTGSDYGARLRAVRDALRRGEPYSRWLLVLDGADDPENIAGLLPHGPGHVLITSQNRSWDQHNTVVLDVPVYDREESVAFVRRRASRIGPGDADRLAEALGDLPLALDQTAGWLSDAAITVPEYVELLHGRHDLESGLKVSADFRMTYQTAFAILINRLRETMPEAVELLRLASCFAPGNISVQLLRGVPVDHLPEGLRGLMEDPLRWSAAIARLVQYSVIRWDAPEAEPDADAESDAGQIHLHRLVHQTVRSGMSEEDLAVYSRAVRRALAAADPRRPTDTRRWPRFAQIVPHLEVSGALRSTHPDIHQLIFNCLRYLFLAGEYTSGVYLSELTERAWREVLGEDDPKLWRLGAQHATLLRGLGEYARCERIDRAVAERLSVLLGEQHLGVLHALDGLGADLRGLARYQESLEVSQRVLDGYLELVGPDDSRTLSARNNLAVSLRLLGRYREALDLDRLTLARRRELLRPRHNYSLASESTYGLDLRLLGRYSEAASVLEPSVETHRVVMGHDNPQTLSVEFNLAMCLHRSGERAEAERRIADLVERASRVLGDSSPVTVRFLAGQAFIQRAQGHLDQARATGERVTEHYRVRLGPQHPYTIGTSANQALVLRALGERQQAALLIEEALADMTSALGPDHPWTLGIALNAAASRSLEDDLEGAVELSRDTVRRAARTLGRRHPLFLSAQISLAHDLRAVRRSEEADKTEEEALSGLISTLGSQHSHTVSARNRKRPYWDFEPLAT